MSLRWGILGAARTARLRFLPAVKEAGHRIVSVASRDPVKAKLFAAECGAGSMHVDYADVLADPAVDAVYIPLPNNLHAQWSIMAVEAGKDVLCEKPAGLDAVEVEGMIAARDRTGRLITEALMTHYHPQWSAVRDLIGPQGRGVISAHMTIAYENRDPNNIRNRADLGGGALYDIGCYPVAIYRELFRFKPLKVKACAQIDEGLGTDIFSTGTLDFGFVHATFTCATQMARRQSLEISTDDATITVVAPVNAADGETTCIHIAHAGFGRCIEIAPSNQYAIQLQAFHRAVRGDRSAAITLEQSLENARVLGALRMSARSDCWISP